MSEQKRNTLSEVFRFKRFALFALAVLVTAILCVNNHRFMELALYCFWH